MLSRFITSILITLSLFITMPSSAQFGNGGQASIKVLGDYILVPATFEAEGVSKPTHFVIDLKRPVYLGLHEVVMRSIQQDLEPNDKVELIADGLRLETAFKNVQNISRNSSMLDTLTADYDQELKQTDVAVIVGFELLKEFVVNINLQDNTLSLTPSTGAGLTKAKSNYQYVFDNLVVDDKKALLPVNNGSKELGYMWLGLEGYHTYQDERKTGIYQTKGKLQIGDENNNQVLSEIVAIRPVDQLPVTLGERNDIVAVSGLSLWQAYELEVNFKAGYLALNKLKNQNIKQEDIDFYAASYANQVPHLQKFVYAKPQGKHVKEAIEQAVDLIVRDPSRLNPTETKELVSLAVEHIEDRRKLDLVSPLCFQFDDARDAVDVIEHTVLVCEQALALVHLSQSPSFRQLIQMRLGALQLDLGNEVEGWKYYLSASFNGDPRPVAAVPNRMGLARAYTAMKRYHRAYSTYKRLLIDFPDEIPRDEIEDHMKALAKHIDPDDELLEPIK